MLMKNSKTGYPIGKPTNFDQPTKTQQHMEPATNIRNIVRNWRETGTLVNPYQVMSKVPQYGDVSGVENLQTCLNTIKIAQEAFNSLPSQIRAEMRNDPVELLRFVSDPNNRERAMEIGLIPRPPKPKPEPGPVPDPAKYTDEQIRAAQSAAAAILAGLKSTPDKA